MAANIHPAAPRPSTIKTTGRGVGIIVNPIEGTDVYAELSYHDAASPISGTVSPAVTSTPGTSHMSPPPSYHDIPGTVPAQQGASRGPPPSYEDAVDPNAEPPSYDSLFGRIRDTHKASRNFIDFLAKVTLLFVGTVGCTIVYSIVIVIPICMITLGIVHMQDCPAEPCIPIFLIVGGSVSILKYVINIGTSRSGRAAANGDERPPIHPVQYCINCFLCAWFITGCVWVYRIHPPIMDHVPPDGPKASTYCNRVVYEFAFWLITSAYIFLGLFTSCICCFSVVLVALKSSSSGVFSSE